jgi:acyl carrier protein
MDRSEFIGIVRDELDLPLQSQDLESDFDQIVSWDSMHLLRLITALEAETGTRLKIGQLMADRSLSAIYQRVAS